MKNKELIHDIRKNYTFSPDDKVFDRILEHIQQEEPEALAHSAPGRHKILRPALVFSLVLLLIASSFAVTAAVNQDVRSYLIAIFGGNPNPVEGELIGVTIQSEGVELTVDAVVAEGNTLFMIYTLKDKDERVFEKTTFINSFTAIIGEDPNYGATYNTVIENGGKNHMILYGKDVKKGIQNVQFSIASLNVPDPSLEFKLAIGTTSYVPEGVTGYTIDEIRLVDNRIVAEITVHDESLFALNYNLRAENTKSGAILNQEGEETTSGNDKEPKHIKWYSQKLDSESIGEYRFVVGFDRVYDFKKPLQVAFPVDFSRKPLKVIYPEDVKIGNTRIEKVTVNQMSLFAVLKDESPNSPESDRADRKPASISDTQNFFLDEPPDTSPMSHQMTVHYEDGSEAAALSGSATSMGDDEYWSYLILNGSLDFSRKPVLSVGTVEIPLY